MTVRCAAGFLLSKIAWLFLPSLHFQGIPPSFLLFISRPSLVNACSSSLFFSILSLLFSLLLAFPFLTSYCLPLYSFLFFTFPPLCTCLPLSYSFSFIITLLHPSFSPFLHVYSQSSLSCFHFSLFHYSVVFLMPTVFRSLSPPTPSHLYLSSLPFYLLSIASSLVFLSLLSSLIPATLSPPCTPSPKRQLLILLVLM